MKNAFVIVTLSGLLAACAVAPPQEIAGTAGMPAANAPAASPQEAASGDDPAFAEAGEAAAGEDESLPKVALTSELLYSLMKAELDFKSGNWQAAYMTMMGTAQQTRDPRLARRAAEMALGAKQAEQSMAAIRLWRELAPDSDEAAQYYLGFAIMADQFDEVGQIFQRRLKEAPPATRGLVMFQMQQLLGRAKDKAGAAALLERLLTPYAGIAEAHIVLAQSAFARGANELAVKEARAALAFKPESEIAVLTLAQVTPDQDQVAALLAKFLAANPNAREARAAHARVLVNQKRYAQARAEFQALLKDQPDNLGTLYALGIMSMQLNDAAAAEKYFVKFIEVHAARPDEQRDASKVRMILAQLAEERGDLKGAVAWLDKVDDEEEDAWFAVQLKRAQLIGKQGDLEGGRALLASLKAEQPAEQAQVVQAQAQLLREAGQNEQAYAVLEAGAKKFPANPDLLYDFALLAEKTGRLEVMEATLRAVMAQAPDNHHAYNALGYSLAERNVRLDEALALIDKAMKMAPEDPFIMDSLGWVYYRLGKLNEAEQQLRRAYTLRSDPEIAVHLGEVLWYKGQKADAQKLWREARAKDPKNDTLKSTLARLQLSL